MRLVYVGAVEGSRVGLSALIAAGLAPALVVTLPPEAADRHSDFADLTGLAGGLGLPVHHTRDINAPATLAAIAAAEPDLTAVIGWSQICRAPFRAIAHQGAIGFHPAALPRLRGRAVIPWTILTGERESGSTLFWLDEGVDSGPILAQRRFAVAADETARSLYDRHTANLAAMLPEAVRRVASGVAPRLIQDETAATYGARRRPDDGRIDWGAPAEAVLRLVRAVGDPYPGAFTMLAGKPVRINRARRHAESHRFVGLAGQIQARTPGGFIVLCGDGGAVEVTGWRTETGDPPPIHANFEGARPCWD